MEFSTCATSYIITHVVSRAASSVALNAFRPQGAAARASNTSRHTFLLRERRQRLDARPSALRFGPETHAAPSRLRVADRVERLRRQQAMAPEDGPRATAVVLDSSHHGGQKKSQEQEVALSQKSSTAQ